MNCDDLINKIKQNILIKQPIFVYDWQFNFITKYNGMMEAENSLKIRHEKIKQYALLNKPYSGKEGEFYFSFHKLLK